MLILCPWTKTLKDRSLSLGSSRNSRAEIKIDHWPKIALSDWEVLKGLQPFFSVEKICKPSCLFLSRRTLEVSVWVVYNHKPGESLLKLSGDVFSCAHDPILEEKYPWDSGPCNCTVGHFRDSCLLVSFYWEVNTVGCFQLLFSLFNCKRIMII